MDVEKTLHALLESQFRAELRADRADQRADRVDKRMDRFDKQLHVTADLVKKGLKIVVGMRKETKFKLDALLDGQIRSDAKLDRLLASLGGKSTNGRHK